MKHMSLRDGNLPHLTSGLPAIPGRLRVELDDFVVDEIPAYEPSGEGEHLFVRFRKRDLTTPEAVRRMANALGVEPGTSGWAGMKDRHAVTTQWASFQGASSEAAAALELEGIEILEAVAHRHKLRTGHLRGNRFVLRVRDAGPYLGEARQVLDRLVESGLPNYFGEQRFGRGGENLPRARQWLVEGGRAPRRKLERKLLVSVLQSWLFNEALADRLRDGLFDRPAAGDLLRKEETGGLFTTDDLDEAARRMADWEISATGPMFGPRMRWPEGEAREREAALLERMGVENDHIARFGRAGEGTRRPYRVRPGRVEVESEGDALRVGFDLPSGSYATAVMREVLKA